MTAPSRLLPLLALLVGAAAIGFAPIFVRLTETGPAAAGFWRLAFAFPVLALAAGAAARREPGRGWALGWGLLAGVLFAGDMGFWHYGVTFTSVTNATVLTNLTPVVVTAAAWLLFRERPGKLFLAALALALAGAALLASAKGGGGRGTNPPLGDLFSLITALWYGGYFLAVRQARTTTSAMRVMAISSAAGAPLLLLAAVLLKEDLTPETAAGWWSCAALGLVHVIGQGAIAWALGRLPTALASIVVFVQPVVAAILGRLIFGEAVTPMQMLGGAVALSGVVLAQWSAARTKTGAEAVRPPRP